MTEGCRVCVLRHSGSLSLNKVGASGLLEQENNKYRLLVKMFIWRLKTSQKLKKKKKTTPNVAF